MVWPYLPEYRLPFCQAAYEQLQERGFGFTLWTGRPSSDQGLRGDAAEAPWHRVLPEVRAPVAGKTLHWRRLPERTDLLIVEQAIKYAETYPALVRQHRSGPGVAVWGHGRSYSSEQGRAAAALKQFVTRRAQWAFIYTQA